jgi:transposase
MKSKYSEAFVEQALVKVFSRGERSVRSVAEELNVNYHALKHWMKEKKGTPTFMTCQKRLSHWVSFSSSFCIFRLARHKQIWQFMAAILRGSPVQWCRNLETKCNAAKDGYKMLDDEPT